MTLRFSISVAFSAVVGAPDAGALTRYAEQIERCGFHAIYFTDHFLHNGPSLHSVSAAAIAIDATERARVGFAAYVLPLRHPIQAANEAAMLDQLSGGRLEFGVAAGSHAPEFAAFGIPFEERGRRLTEGIAALKTLWTEPRASFRGHYWTFDDVFVEPPVAQEPHPPLWIGSWAGPAPAARRIARFADGWQASGLHTTVADFESGWRSVESACEEIGRDPASVRRAYVNAVTHLSATTERAWGEVPSRLREREELRVVGTPDDAVKHLRRLEGAGVEEVSLLIQDWSYEQLRLIADEVMPAFR